ncbi:MAG: type IV pilus modification protein PilV [Cocleimonas sp.]|nr:type IV pilus modification protein PilV [Cocleimonas sp.]
MQNTLKKQSGFSLLEVLISMVILSVGLLGLGGLQVASLKGANNAHSRNVANMLVMELADRMRANPSGVRGGFYAVATQCATTETACRGTTYCSGQDKAKFDLQEIFCGMDTGSGREGGVRNLLFGDSSLDISCPAGSCITVPGVIRAQHDITIGWGEVSIDARQKDNSGVVNNGNIQALTLTVPVIP